MNAVFKTGGLNPIGPFSGQEICDEHVVEVRGRRVQLNKSFWDLGCCGSGLGKVW